MTSPVYRGGPLHLLFPGASQSTHRNLSESDQQQTCQIQRILLRITKKLPKRFQDLRSTYTEEVREHYYPNVPDDYFKFARALSDRRMTTSTTPLVEKTSRGRIPRDRQLVGIDSD